MLYECLICASSKHLTAASAAFARLPVGSWEIAADIDTVVHLLDTLLVEVDIPARRVDRDHHVAVLAGRAGKAGRVDKIGVVVVENVVLKTRYSVHLCLIALE